MAKLAWCETCKATYPLCIVFEAPRPGAASERGLVCPLGHREVREVESPPSDER